MCLCRDLVSYPLLLHLLHSQLLVSSKLAQRNSRQRSFDLLNHTMGFTTGLTYTLLSLQVRDGGYDYKVNETVNVVTAKTTEIGHKTWGLMKGVMAFASQKVEELSKDNPTWNSDSWQRNETQGNGSYQEFGRSNGISNSAPASGVNGGGSVSSSGRNFSSWDDWDNDGHNKSSSTSATAASKGGDDWAGWDDVKDDPYDSYKSDAKTGSHVGKSDGNWSGAGFL